jgi:hypothetical protein
VIDFVRELVCLYLRKFIKLHFTAVDLSGREQFLSERIIAEPYSQIRFHLCGAYWLIHSLLEGLSALELFATSS